VETSLALAVGQLIDQLFSGDVDVPARGGLIDQLFGRYVDALKRGRLIDQLFSRYVNALAIGIEVDGLASGQLIDHLFSSEVDRPLWRYLERLQPKLVRHGVTRVRQRQQPVVVRVRRGLSHKLLQLCSGRFADAPVQLRR